MTPRSLFVIIIKVIAIYLIIDSLSFIPQLLSSLFFVFQSSHYPGGSTDSVAAPLLLLIVIIGFYVFFFRLCLFKTDWIIDKLRLDKGFSEEKFEINIHRSTVLKIAVIVIGAVMVIDSLPLLCKQTISYLQMSHTYMRFTDNRESGWMIYYFLKFFIGFSLMSANRPIVNYIERKRKGPAVSATTTE